MDILFHTEALVSSHIQLVYTNQRRGYQWCSNEQHRLYGPTKGQAGPTLSLWKVSLFSRKIGHQEGLFAFSYAGDIF